MMFTSDIAKGGQTLLCPATEIEKDQDTVIEQSNILIQQSVGQVVPCQLTESGYTPVNCLHGL